MLKNIIRTICQKIVGYDNYLFIFSLYNIKRVQKGRLEKEFNYFVSLIPNEGVVLDIGANIGVMTVFLAQKLNRAFVYSFEPVPDNIKALSKVLNFYQLSNVKVFETALGEQAGEVKMILPVQYSAKMQGLSHVVENEQEQGYIFSVPVQKLDEIEALKNASKIVAIKIDVENFEYYVLKGGRKVLLAHRPLIYCELWDNDRRTHCLAYLQELGYRVKVYEENRLADFTGQKVNNFFFLPV